MMTSQSLFQGLVQVAILGNVILLLFYIFSRWTSGTSPNTKSLIWRTSLIPLPLLLFWTDQSQWVSSCVKELSPLCPQWLGAAVTVLPSMGQGAQQEDGLLLFALWGVPVLSLAILGLGTYHFRLRKWLLRACLADESLHLVVRQVADDLELRRLPKVLMVHNLGSPAIAGVWSPKLLLPVGLDNKLSKDEVRAALAHELAHLKNGDHWWNFYLWLHQCAFFFVPLLWIAGKEMHRVQEMAADEIAVTRGGAKRSQLASALAWVGAGLTPSIPIPFVASALRPKQALKDRIAALAHYRRPRVVQAWMSFVGVGILVFGFTLLAERYWPSQVVISAKGKTEGEPIMCYPVPDIMKTIEATKKGRC
ncbi:MAG: M56 family metallopeptidase [Bdellovibrionaceae bacterium]|nr:M56 family metallopeptidase [Bdellovibrionales bacterium]MCB9085555.1 M56 family metallopeptidase [Pseudobdellovibrionaceae bacterium]